MFQPIVLQPQLIHAFSRLIADKLGFHLREQSHTAFWQKVLLRVKALGLSSVEAYYQLLNSSYQPVTENSEWRELINFLSITESYFFRDQGQFALLRTHVLPELIAHKQKLTVEGSAKERSLKIWSAGCATGEEAYSLAILLKELIPADEDWSLFILGTDINQAALAQAQRGVYSDWSFRSVQAETQKKYFQPHHQGWKIISDIAKLVTFRLDNLVGITATDFENHISNLDLIICRNVFIYFNPDAINLTLQCFYQALSPGGYLLTGHTELHGHKHHQFKVKAFSQSVVYQREANSAPGTSTILPELNILSLKPEKNLQLAVPKERSSSQPIASRLEPERADITVLETIIERIKRKAYADAIAQAKQLVAQNIYPFRAYCLLAEAYANLGQHASAVAACQQAFQYDPLAVEPLYLLAQVAQEQGDLERAKSLLKRVIYLAPSSTFAYFELGCLYEQQGNLEKAQRNWRSSLNDLKRLAGETIVDGCKDLTASKLLMAIEQKLSQEAFT